MYSGGSVPGGPQQQPDYPAALSSLQHMGSDQLKDILNNEDKFDQFIKDLPQMKALQDEKEMLLTSNKSLAEYNLSQEPVMRETKAKLQEKYQAAQRLGQEVKTLKADLDTKQGNVSPDTLMALLEAANQEVEEESELMMDNFLASGGNLEEFLDQYHEKRKLAHMRRVKVDKLKELTSKTRPGSGTPARVAPPPPGQQGRSPAYGAPSPAYGAPSPAYGAPSPGYGAPSNNWGGYPQLPYPAQPTYNMPMPP